MAAGATMNSTTPSTRPTTMEITISRCPNSSSVEEPSPACRRAGASASLTTSRVR